MQVICNIYNQLCCNWFSFTSSCRCRLTAVKFSVLLNYAVTDNQPEEICAGHQKMAFENSDFILWMDLGRCQCHSNYWCTTGYAIFLSLLCFYTCVFCFHWFVGFYVIVRVGSFVLFFLCILFGVKVVLVCHVWSRSTKGNLHIITWLFITDCDRLCHGTVSISFKRYCLNLHWCFL